MDYTIMSPEYFAPLPDLDMALARIGLRRSDVSSPGLENLRTLMDSCLMTVPFENLDIYDYKRQIDFCLPHLFEKFVINRRGGYCYESNGFFMGILEALGYTCSACQARILFGGNIMTPVAHRITIVTLGNTRYLCDVGFGGAGCAEGPVNLDDPGIQEIGGHQFSIRRHEGDILGDMTLVTHTPREASSGVPEGESGFYTFYTRPQSPLEFIALNNSMATNPVSMFSLNRVVRMRTPTGTLVIDNKIFRKTVNSEVVEEEITTNKRLYEILTGEFKMIVPKMSYSTDFPREWF
ncbi:N-acetyltransferase superfamily [Treponema primitia ZAS-2]|uniref:N-acetyltransferase superfamily n=1 Tax=Treponema primitia (strain ATCC BAA-887 / DSM 12427 / ZAS-2) TaxID=545694 RepID=F5YLU4_TREPZ|nr:arylamine N-acetyltransferase [Treponema primitia]AEF85931.1 N-acetyltransferase superfamily [Treponema primitia ZAS-2]